MKKGQLYRVSPEQRRELKERARLKYLLVQEQIENDGYTHCSTCGRQTGLVKPGYLELAHIIALSRGGKTELGNVVLEGGGFVCGCSAKYEKKPEDRPVGTPGHRKYNAMILKGLV